VGAVLLGAGAGTRLRPLTLALPKPAIPILDIPLGAYGLASLSRLGAPVVLNVAHMGEALTEALTATGLGSEVLDEAPRPYGTAGTLDRLRARLADPFLTYNSDLVADIDLDGLVASHRRLGCSATLAVQRTERRGDLRGTDGIVERFIDRRAADEPGLLYLGVGIFDREVLGLIPEGSTGIGLAETVLRPLAERRSLAYFEHDGYWKDVGTLDRYLDASLDVLEGRAPPLPVPTPGEIIEVSGGKAYLGPGAQADEACLGPGAILLSGARAARRIQRSIVWPGAAVPEGRDLHRAIWFSNQAIAADAT
jgi:NDP-sugar pyrophosphorylase family protein